MLEKSFWFLVPVAKAMKFLFQLKNGSDNVAINNALASSGELKTGGKEYEIRRIAAEKRMALTVVMAKFDEKIPLYCCGNPDDIFWIRQLFIPKEIKVERIR